MTRPRLCRCRPDRDDLCNACEAAIDTMNDDLTDQQQDQRDDRADDNYWRDRAYEGN